MRKSKEDTQLTREKIIESAFESFFELGYAETSLSLIAENAGMTRGAIYWHFKDKNELYREVVKIAAEKADVVKFAYSLSEDLSYKERMLSLFLFSQNNRYVDFIYKTINQISVYKEFEDLFEMIKLNKINLFRYFVEETRMHIRSEHIRNVMLPEYYASDLYLIFEGLFLTKNVPIGLICDREHIRQYRSRFKRSVIAAVLPDDFGKDIFFPAGNNENVRKEKCHYV